MADNSNSGGGGSTAIVGVVAILAILVVLYFLFGQGLLNPGSKQIDADIKIETPTTK